MASSYVMHRLPWRGRGRLAKCLTGVQTGPYRSVGTTAVASRDEAQQKEEADQKDEPKSFYVVLAERLAQAQRSVLINCFHNTNEKKFLNYLSKHGTISNYFFYNNHGIHAVVEFADRESVSSLLEETGFPSVSHESAVPFKSRYLFLKNMASSNSQNQQTSFKCHPQTTIPINNLIEKLSREESIDQQINSLTSAFQLTEENSRLRFLVCSLLQDIAGAFFPECIIKPFGSSVNGFGKLGCDLDMFLDLDDITGIKAKRPRLGLSMEYQLKTAHTERAVTQKILTVIGETVEQFGPGCVGLQKILNARCPVVRFSHQPSGFQCDLTANNRVAMKSTELLYFYGSLDPRVRGLVFTVRCWARVQAITSSVPGAWISNFSLTVLVLFFLQNRNPPIIPNLDHLSDLAGPADKCVIEGNDCTFVSDFSKIQLQSNTETLEQLLCEFFDFYATFPFNKMSINIRKGKSQNKSEVDPLHIQNPFETSLNVSKNVNITHLNRFVALCQESSWLLHQRQSGTHKVGNATTHWGLASLLVPVSAQTKSRKKKKGEMASDMIKDLLQSIKNNQQKKS